MILFYSKKTGDIIGTVEGRVHSTHQLNMWIGDKEEVGRIVCQWEPVAWYDRRGDMLPHNRKHEAHSVYFEPDHEQKGIFSELDKAPHKATSYKVNLSTHQLELK